MCSIVVTGGTGTVGREVLKLLAERDIAARATTRDVKAAPHRAGVEWIQLTEYGCVDSRGLAGADGLFLLAPSGCADQWAVLSPWIRAATRGKVARVVLMTAQEVDDHSDSPFRRAELELIHSGLSYVILRPSWFMQNFHTFWGNEIRRHSMIAQPAGDGRVAFIDARDIAAVAVSQLCDDVTTSGTFVLTGPEALDHTQVANILSIETGRKIAYRNLDPGEFRQALGATSGMPEDYIDLLLDMFTEVRAGAAAGVTDHVERLCGRPAHSLARYARDYRDRLI